MKPLVNPLIDRREYERHNTTTRHYIKTQREKGLILEIGPIVVDAEQLILRTFQCNTVYCVKCTGEGTATKYKGSCCTDLVVDLTGDEKEKLVELARIAQEKIQFKPNDPVKKVVERILADKVTEMNDAHDEIFMHKANGACAMSWNEPVTGQLRCSINSLCMKLELPIDVYKPTPCYLFPLHYCEFAPERIIVTLLTEETQPWVQQHVTVGRLKCLRKPERGAPPAYIALRGEIEHLISPEFYAELDRQAQPILKQHGIAV